MIDWLIDTLFDFDFSKNPGRVIQTGGWFFLVACLAMLLDHELVLLAVGIALVGAGFVAAGLYTKSKKPPE